MYMYYITRVTPLFLAKLIKKYVSLHISFKSISTQLSVIQFYFVICLEYFGHESIATKR